jgi:hypothetical protein
LSTAIITLLHISGEKHDKVIKVAISKIDFKVFFESIAITFLNILPFLHPYD